MNSTILAYAFLKASYGKAVQSPIDALVPLVKRALMDQSPGGIALEAVQSSIKKTFGLEIPINVIRYTFSRIAQQSKLIELNRKTHIYQRTGSRSGLDEIINLETESRNQYKRLKASITDVISNFSELRIDADEVLEAWLDESAISFLGGRIAANHASGRDREINRIVSIAIRDDEHGEHFSADLADVALGDALYRAIKAITEYDNKQDEEDLAGAVSIYNSKMKNVDVYFDTRIVLRALGYVNDDMKKSAFELMHLCQSLNANLSVFDHTLNEIAKIIKTVASRLTTTGEVTGDVANHAIEAGLSPGTLVERAMELQCAVEKLGFTIKPAPELSEDLSINESSLDLLLKRNLRKDALEARITDIKSLSAIYRHRRGQAKRYLEKCDAIFVTSNKALADTATEFFGEHFKTEEDTNRVQHCMTDVVFSMRLWTKLPTSLNQLPRHQIVSHALSNLSVSADVKERFLTHVQELLDDGRLTDEQAMRIKLSRYTDELISLSNYQNNATVEQANNLAHQIIEKQQQLLDAIKREAGQDNATLQQANDNLKQEIGELTDDYQSQLDKLAEDNQALGEELEGKTEEIAKKETKIKFIEGERERLYRQCGVISQVLTYALLILSFMYLVWLAVDKLELSAMVLVAWKQTLAESSEMIAVFDTVFTILFTLMTIYGSSVAGVTGKLSSWLRAKIVSFLIGANS